MPLVVWVLDFSHWLLLFENDWAQTFFFFFLNVVRQALTEDPQHFVTQMEAEVLIYLFIYLSEDIMLENQDFSSAEEQTAKDSEVNTQSYWTAFQSLFQTGSIVWQQRQ